MLEFGFGFVLGLLVAGGLLGRRLVRTLETATGLTVPKEKAGTVTLPGPTPEEKVEQLFAEETVDAGARQIMELAKEQGRRLSYEEARLMALDALAENLPGSAAT